MSREGGREAIPLLTPETYDLRRSLGYLMARSSRAASARAGQAFASEADVSFPQFLALMLLREGVARTPGDLSRLMGYTTGAVTRLIDQLETGGLVRRDRSAKDRRSIDIAVTSRGERTTASLLPLLLDVWNPALKGFEPGEYDMLIRLLEKLRTALEADGEQEPSLAEPDEPLCGNGRR